MSLSSCPVVGVFASSTIYPWAIQQWEGMLQRSKELNITLVSYVGGVIGLKGNGQASVLYDLAIKNNLDGLVIWSMGIGWNRTRSEMGTFIDRYKSIPLVSVEMDFPGIPCLMMEDYQGMCAVIKHLIEVHGRRRIAFLRGIDTHAGAQERYRAYTDTLVEYGIPFDDQLIPPLRLAWDGEAMIRFLLDEHHASFDAVVAASDEMALDAMAILKARGVHIPEDVALTGFDNIVQGMAVTPPLTSAAPPFLQMGRTAVELIDAQIRGRKVSGQIYLPVDLVVRQSCGCASSVFHAATAEAEDLTRHVEHSLNTDSGIQGKEPDLAEIRTALEALTSEENLRELWEKLVREIHGECRGEFLPVLNAHLTQTLEANAAVVNWSTAFAELQRTASIWLSGLPRLDRLRADMIWRQGQALIAERAKQQQSQQDFQRASLQNSLRSINESLITTFNTDALVDIVARELPQLGILGCYLSIYDNPEIPTGDARMILAYDARGRLVLPAGGILFPSWQLAPREFWEIAQSPLHLVLALYFQTENIGFIMFALKKKEDVARCEALCWQLSAALKGARLMQREREFASTDSLTGLLNRRKGWDFMNYEHNKALRTGKPIGVALLDLDKFKLINDHLGHETGDLVLKTVSTCLTTILRKSDIIIRWGGEEFLIVLPETEESGLALVAEKVRMAIESYPWTLKGRRKVTISIGTTVKHNKDPWEQIIDKVDIALYSAKRSGRNRVEFIS